MRPTSWDDTNNFIALLRHSFVNLLCAYAYIAIFLALQLGLYHSARFIDRTIGLGPVDKYDGLVLTVLQVSFALATFAMFYKYLAANTRAAFQAFSPKKDNAGD